MLYAIRNEKGRIVSLSETFSTDSEEVDIKNKEVLEFLSINDDEFSAEDYLEQSDASVSRIFEDLIDVLISKNIIMFTDLPDIAQKKLLSRKLIRNNTNISESEELLKSRPFLLDDDETL